MNPEIQPRGSLESVHWRLAQATTDALWPKLNSRLRQKGVRVREDREDIIRVVVQKLKRSFDADCLLSEVELIAGSARFSSQETSKRKVATLAWRLLEQVRCDFFKRPTNRMQSAETSLLEGLEASDSRETLDIDDLLDSSRLDAIDRQILLLLSRGANQKEIARAIQIDPSTVSRRIKRLKKTMNED